MLLGMARGPEAGVGAHEAELPKRPLILPPPPPPPGLIPPSWTSLTSCTMMESYRPAQMWWIENGSAVGRGYLNR